MLKVTIKFSVFVFFLCFMACKSDTDGKTEEDSMRSQDSLSEARIDSAYITIKNDCDTALLHTVPFLVNSILHGDTLGLSTFFDSALLFKDADKKVEKVIRQLKLDCDSNLLKETYKRVRLLKEAKQPQHKKKKA